MASPQKTGFVHSIKVPETFRAAAKIAKKVKAGEDSLKNLIYNCRRDVKKVYALVVETFKRDDIIEDLIQKSQLLVKEPNFDVWLAKVLIWEMLWGKQQFKRGCKPIETILNYENVLRELLEDCKDSIQPVLKHDILKPRYVRVNTLKITTEEAVNNFIDEGWSLVPFSNKSDYKGFQDCLNNLKSDEFVKDIHIPDLLIFPPKTEFYQHKAYKSGSINLQDKASCLPVHLLAPPPGSIVLDTCAAPGMKTTQLAALIQNEGTVYAVEVNAKREAILRHLVESASATCVKTILKDVMQVRGTDCPDVEYILVDPSCSGSGITDRVEIEKLDLPRKMDRLKKLCNFQAKLLRHTMKAFPKAKRIVYSTCSLNSEENEDVVRQILETSREFKLVNAREKLKSWNTRTSDTYPELGNMCIFATPKEDKTNGFFVAVFERLQEGEKNPYLNYELCKLYDKKPRKNTNKNSEEINEENKSVEISSVNSADGNERTGKSPMKKRKDKKKKIEGDNICIEPFLEKKKNKNTDLVSDISTELDNTFNKEKKKKENKKLDKEENGNTDLLSENSFVFDETTKDKKKKKKNKLCEVENNADQLSEKTKKRNRASIDNEIFEESMCLTEDDGVQGVVKSKTKKAKKN